MILVTYVIILLQKLTISHYKLFILQLGSRGSLFVSIFPLFHAYIYSVVPHRTYQLCFCIYFSYIDIDQICGPPGGA